MIQPTHDALQAAFAPQIQAKPFPTVLPPKGPEPPLSAPPPVTGMSGLKMDTVKWRLEFGNKKTAGPAPTTEDPTQTQQPVGKWCHQAGVLLRFKGNALLMPVRNRARYLGVLKVLALLLPSSLFCRWCVCLSQHLASACDCRTAQLNPFKLHRPCTAVVIPAHRGCHNWFPDAFRRL